MDVGDFFLQDVAGRFVQNEPGFDLRKICQRVQAFDELIVIVADGIEFLTEPDQFCHTVIEGLVTIGYFDRFIQQCFANVFAEFAAGGLGATMGHNIPLVFGKPDMQVFGAVIDFFRHHMIIFTVIKKVIASIIALTAPDFGGMGGQIAGGALVRQPYIWPVAAQQAASWR